MLYGPSGTGKSHLARGLATAWKARYRRRRVVYTTAIDFARDLSDAMETQAMDDLRAGYHKVALLVFEDVDRLAGKQAAQEELIRTFDVLVRAGRRLVVTASAGPARLPGIMPALQMRLAAGLTVPLAAPGPNTRVVILNRLAGLRAIELSQPVARILADGLSATVPELFSALVQLENTSRLAGGRIDAEAVRSYLAGRNDSRKPQLRSIAGVTARFFSLKLSDLRSPSRRRAVVAARGVAMYLARHLAKQSLKQIGEYFGGRDHTTVIHSCRRTEKLLKSDPVIRDAVEHLQRKWQTT